MPKIPSLHPLLQAWLLEGPLSAQVPAYVERLRRGRYATNTAGRYLNGMAHFARWMSMCHLPAHMLDDGCIDQFLIYHLRLAPRHHHAQAHEVAPPGPAALAGGHGPGAGGLSATRTSARRTMAYPRLGDGNASVNELSSRSTSSALRPRGSDAMLQCAGDAITASRGCTASPQVAR